MKILSETLILPQIINQQNKICIPWLIRSLFLFYFCWIHARFIQYTDAFREHDALPFKHRPLGISSNGKLSGGIQTSTQAHEIDGMTIDSALKPIGNRILVKLKESERTTPGGLVLPYEQRFKQIMGKVISVPFEFYDKSSRVTFTPILKPGDWVLFGTDNLYELKYDAENCALISIEDTFAKLDGSDTDFNIEKIHPLRDMVFVKLAQDKKKTASGMILSTQKSKPLTQDGEIIAVGPGGHDYHGKPIPMEVQVGDKIRFNSYASENQEFKINGEKYNFLSVDDILAKW